MWFNILFFALLNGNLRSIFAFLRTTLFENIKFIYHRLKPRIINHVENAASPSNKFTMRRNQLFQLIFSLMWVLACTALSRSFSSVLFNMYFRPYPVSVVSDLEQIVETPNIKLYGHCALDYLQGHYENYTVLKERLDNDENKLLTKMNNNNNNNTLKYQMRNIDTRLMKNILEQILKGEAILFITTYNMSQILLNHPANDLVSTDFKFSHKFQVYYVKRKCAKHKEIIKL